MEVSARIKKLLQVFFLCCIFLFWDSPVFSQPVKKYSISKGSMQIELSRKISDAELEDFIKRFDFGDLALKRFIKNDFDDSLKLQGWKVVVNNKEVVILTKPFASSDELNNPASRIAFTGTVTGNYPSSMNNQVFGYNILRSNNAFSIKDSTITFRVNLNKNVKEVFLAGNFTNWADSKIPMKHTDSGWIAKVNLLPGKYLYKFIADGNWLTDPENTLAENDGEGNTNSVCYMPNTRFTLDGFANAKRVFLVGSFDGWRENKNRLNKTATGWELAMYLMPGTYTYRYLADKKWMTDPGNEKKFPNEFGEFNSVISAGKPTIFRLTGFQNARKVFLAGSFNQWRRFEVEMQRTDSGWQVPYVLGEGNYEYKFFADGQGVDEAGRPVKDNEPGSILVSDPNFTFRLKNLPDAKKVYVAGDFNNWSPNGYRMKKVGNDWVISLHLSKGKHVYKFVVDNNWIKDPGNALWEENEFGTGNSVIWKE